MTFKRIFKVLTEMNLMQPENESMIEPDLPVVFMADGLLHEIEVRLALREPERGGIILATGNLLHTFIEDDHGGYSGSHWDVSDEVVLLCRELQLKSYGIYAGQIHSHPQGVPDPSGPDRDLMKRALDTNPNREFLVVPIVTAGPPRKYDVPLGKHHRLSMMVAVRKPQGPEVIRARVEIVPLSRDLQFTGIRPLFASSTKSIQHDKLKLLKKLTLNGKPHICYPVADHREQILLLDSDYPTSSPSILTPSADGKIAISQVIDWGKSENRGEQLVQLIADANQNSKKHPEDRIDAPGDATTRVEPIVGSLKSKVVLIAGLGSVGSRMAEDLCRSGVGNFILIDPDIVEISNLARSIYVAKDVGNLKTSALSEHLKSINPDVQIRCLNSEIGHVSELIAFISDADIVIGATDDMSQQKLLSDFAYSENRPMVACALYRRGAAGEVVFSIPAANTPCIFCSIVDLDPNIRPEQDYGIGGRLSAEPALGPSIQLVTSFASLLALSLLGGPESEIGQSIIPLVRTKRTYGKISTVPNWDFFPKIFGGQGHQHAPQSVWIKSASNPGCYTCGDERHPPADRSSGKQLAEFLSVSKNNDS